MFINLSKRAPNPLSPFKIRINYINIYILKLYYTVIYNSIKKETVIIYYYIRKAT